MSCLDNIVSIRKACDAPALPSLSGYDIMDAPELSNITLAAIANNKYVTGFNVAKCSMAQAIREINSDFLAVLAANKVQPNLVTKHYPTSEFIPQLPVPPSNKERGLTLYKNSKHRGELRKTRITKLRVYPLASAESARIMIYDNGLKTTYTVQLVANQVNTFDIDYTVQSKFARVLLDNAGLQLASAKLICYIGCDGKLPNDCGHTKGYDGTGEISSKEAFGLGVEFACECDYSQILCDLSKAYTGKLIYLKTRELLLDERIYSDRSNNWTIYGKEEAKEKKAEVSADYVAHWNTFVDSLGNILVQYKDDCLECKRMKWKTNI